MSNDDELIEFEALGAGLPADGSADRIEHDGASVWFARHGEGEPVVLLHGGLGHSGNFARVVPDLVAAGRQLILIDSRGHGRSTQDGRPFSYELMGGDVVAVLDALGIGHAPIVGWSDGACTGLVLANEAPERVAGVFFFACNMDPGGALPFEMTPVIGRCFARHRKDYQALSMTPGEFDALVEAVGLMQRTQPDYSAVQLARISVPVTIALGEHDEFIRREHAEYLARTIPRAKLTILPGVSHFAPLQRPDVFNAAVLEFLNALPASA